MIGDSKAIPTFPSWYSQWLYFVNGKMAKSRLIEAICEFYVQYIVRGLNFETIEDDSPSNVHISFFIDEID